jgi:uncharacterized membrane protein YccC
MFGRILTSLSTRFRIIGLLFVFLAKNKMWWLMPMVVVLLLFFLIIILGGSTPLGPFIYTII